MTGARIQLIPLAGILANEVGAGRPAAGPGKTAATLGCDQGNGAAVLALQVSIASHGKPV
jgi:hypothetical protein